MVTILDYGIIGNCKTCALVKKDGSVDWMCYPRFDSPSIFARLLDPEGGHLSVKPIGRYRKRQRYLPGTAILETTFTSKNASFQVLDFFPRYRKLLRKGHEKLFKQNRLVRIIKPLKGRPRVRVSYQPRPDYARCAPNLADEEGQLLARCNGRRVGCITNFPHEALDGGQPVELRHTHYLVVGQPDDPANFSVRKCLSLFHATKRYWERWVDTLILPERYRERIIRSAITLKLLTDSKTGAIIAAATTSIPEQLDSSRTFDYRYCWIRDAAFCVDAFKKIGRGWESRKLMDFAIKHVLPKRKVQIIYDIDGGTDLVEQELPHLAGYEGNRPVRVGNAAHDQRQNDIYGELIDIMYLYFAYYEYEGRMTEKYWTFLRYLVGQIGRHWNEPDSGIWEFRGMHRHYTYSKLMCYVGVDRAIRLAQHYGKDGLAHRWAPLRDRIRHDLLAKGFDGGAKAFTMHYGSRELDASVLLMAYHEFLEPSDPRMVSTVKAVYDGLRQGSLLQRYKVRDDFGMPTSAFTICSFWMVDALHYIGEEKKARRFYERLCKYANHLGLFSEDVDLATGQLLGNFPQAYTHIALINSSILLSEWSAKRKRIDWGRVRRQNWF